MVIVMRSEVEVVADTVIHLLAAKLIAILPSDERGAEARSRICAVTGINHDDLFQAQERWLARDKRLIKPSPAKPSSFEPEGNPNPRPPKPRPPQPDNNADPWPSPEAERSDFTLEEIRASRAKWEEGSDRYRAEDDHVRCSGMGVAEPHWAPAAVFKPKDKNHPWRPRAACDEHWAVYQSTRHLKIEQLDQLSKASIAVEIMEGDPTFVCVVCGDPIGVESNMKISGVTMHAGCAQ